GIGLPAEDHPAGQADPQQVGFEMPASASAGSPTAPAITPPAVARPSPAGIRRARGQDPKPRERDFAAGLGISEAEYVAAHVGYGVRRLRPDVETFIHGAGALGEVMALTRNDSAVHEKIGSYDKPVSGSGASMLLGEDIDLRIFPKHWAFAF